MAVEPLIRSGTVEVIQQFGTSPAVAPRPILSPVAVAQSFQIEDQLFAGFYAGSEDVAGELVGTGDNVTTVYTLDNTPVVVASVVLHKTTATGPTLTVTTHYTVTTGGVITLTPAGVTFLGTDQLFADYTFTPSQTYGYPEIIQGADILDTTQVKVFLRTAEDIFDITNGFGVIVTTSSVTVPGALVPSRRITALNGQVTLAASTDTIIDTTLDYFALGVRTGDVLSFVTLSVDLDFPDSVVSVDATPRNIIGITNAFTLKIDPVAGPTTGKVEYVIDRVGSSFGDILISYTARRTDQIGRLLSFENTTELEESLGPIVPANPLAYAISLMLANTSNQVFGLMVKEDTTVEHQKALDFLESEDVYLLAPMTFDKAVTSIYQKHVDAMSEPLKGRERRVIFSHEAKEREVYQTLSTTGSISKNTSTFTDANAQFLANGVKIGSVIRLASNPATLEIDSVNRTEVIITNVISNTQVTLIGDLTLGEEKFGTAVGTGDGSTTVFNLIDTANVITASVVIYFNGVAQSPLSFTATTAGLITFVSAPGVGVVITADYELSVFSGINYTVETQLLTNSEIAKLAADVGVAYRDRRVTVAFGNLATVDSGEDVPGYFLNAAFAGLVAGVAANQPLANTPIAGFTRVKHIRDFSDTDLGTIAGGGLMVYMQDRITTPVVSRNSITTDLANVNTREHSIVHMADFYSKALRNNVGPLAGRFNITQDFIDNMLVPAINGNNRDLMNAGLIGPSSVLVSVERGQDVGGPKDQLFVIVDLELFAPANRITVTVRIN